MASYQLRAWDTLGIKPLARKLGLDWRAVDTVVGQRLVAKRGTIGWGRIRRCGWYELDTELFYRHVIKPAAHVVDAGVNEGVLAVIAAKLAGDDGRVVGFDPNPAPLAIAETAARRNHVRIELIECAVDSDTASLDSLVDQADVLKVDVDGPELDVLQGATRLLVARPPLAIEFSAATSPALFDFLHDRSYHIYASRMKFARVLRVESPADLAALPVRLERGEVANLYCVNEPLDVEAVWPSAYVPDAYRRHFLSPVVSAV